MCVAIGKAPSDIPTLKPYWGKLTVRKCDQEKAGVFSGRQTHRGKSQSLVAWIAGRKVIESLKPIDKAIFGMVSESSGRNESERRGSLENGRPGGRALVSRVKAVWSAAD